MPQDGETVRGGDESHERAEDDIKWMEFFIAERRWQRGKADPSHEYTIREWMPDSQTDFERTVRIIRSLGQAREFHSELFVYLDVGDMKYWTMGSSVSETTVINRAEL
jgi:hypothetical protein